MAEYFTPEELYEIWAPRASVWSPWVPPVFFSHIQVPREPAGPSLRDLPSADWYNGERAAIILDLPEGQSIRTALALAERGCRPVPMFNSAPQPHPYPAAHSQVSTAVTTDRLTQADVTPTGELSLTSARPFVTLDMSRLALAFAEATPTVQQIRLPADAPPAFLLDALRIKGHHLPMPNRFDNRWMVFPQDFPSARFLKEQGITHVLLVDEERSTLPQDDLAHVLLRWQEGGLQVWRKAPARQDPPRKVTVHTPSRFRALWYRALAMLDFRRNSAGGFGSVIPEPSSSGGGFG